MGEQKDTSNEASVSTDTSTIAETTTNKVRGYFRRDEAVPTGQAPKEGTLSRVIDFGKNTSLNVVNGVVDGTISTAKKAPSVGKSAMRTGVEVSTLTYQAARDRDMDKLKAAGRASLNFKETVMFAREVSAILTGEDAIRRATGIIIADSAAAAGLSDDQRKLLDMCLKDDKKSLDLMARARQAANGDAVLSENELQVLSVYSKAVGGAGAEKFKLQSTDRLDLTSTDNDLDSVELVGQGLGLGDMVRKHEPNLRPDRDLTNRAKLFVSDTGRVEPGFPHSGQHRTASVLRGIAEVSRPANPQTETNFEKPAFYESTEGHPDWEESIVYRKNEVDKHIDTLRDGEQKLLDVFHVALDEAEDTGGPSYDGGEKAQLLAHFLTAIRRRKTQNPYVKLGPADAIKYADTVNNLVISLHADRDAALGTPNTFYSGSINVTAASANYSNGDKENAFDSSPTSVWKPKNSSMYPLTDASKYSYIRFNTTTLNDQGGPIHPIIVSYTFTLPTSGFNKKKTPNEWYLVASKTPITSVSDGTIISAQTGKGQSYWNSLGAGAKVTFNIMSDKLMTAKYYELRIKKANDSQGAAVIISEIEINEHNPELTYVAARDWMHEVLNAWAKFEGRDQSYTFDELQERLDTLQGKLNALKLPQDAIFDASDIQTTSYQCEPREDSELDYELDSGYIGEQYQIQAINVFPGICADDEDCPTQYVLPQTMTLATSGASSFHIAETTEDVFMPLIPLMADIYEKGNKNPIVSILFSEELPISSDREDWGCSLKNMTSLESGHESEPVIVKNSLKVKWRKNCNLIKITFEVANGDVSRGYTAIGEAYEWPEHLLETDIRARLRFATEEEVTTITGN